MTPPPSSETALEPVNCVWKVLDTELYAAGCSLPLDCRMHSDMLGDDMINDGLRVVPRVDRPPRN